MPNRLIHEQSPYLLQHANNPVDWYPWGDEAFERATAENKPVIVSIGYAACHWCHVMEHESFEDADTAAYMNEHFVCIKVDREEHPDVDAMYMDAVQAISGSGGWPLNAFVTPGRVPFYGGTYYPPRPAFNRPSWMQLMMRMTEIWATQKSEVDAQSEQMLNYLKQTSKAAARAGSGASAKDCRKMAESLLKMADREFGGFGGAPKFPGTMAIRFLLEHYRFTGNREALDIALLSLDKMIAGGIYDQIGGGFARYSTDREWLVPHFEKMLYDNALLVAVLAEAWATGERPAYAGIIRQTVAFVSRELQGAEGGFCSALDADSEGVEGKFYVWTWEDWIGASGGGDALAEAYWGISPEGNWEEVNILHEAMSLGEAADRAGMTLEAAQQRIRALVPQLSEYRATRVRPALDDKRLLSWNALWSSALTAAAAPLATLGDHADDNNLGSAMQKTVARHLQWMLDSFRGADETLLRVWKGGQARIQAKLDDYAYLIQALIDHGLAAGDYEWLVKAAVFCDAAIALFSTDDDADFLCLSSKQQTDIPVRKVEIYDGAQPSANAILAGSLMQLGFLMERSDYVQRAESMLQRMLSSAVRYTYSFSHWATLLQRFVAGYRSVVVTGPEMSVHFQELASRRMPQVQVIHTGNTAENLPLTAGKKSERDSLIFVCTATACLPPVSRPDHAESLLQRDAVF
jgi:uncharacterized protein YyaL (SSP411 family)